MIHGGIFTLLNYTTRASEHFLHRSLTKVVNGFDAELIPDRLVIDVGGQFYNDMIVVIVLIVIFLTAAFTYRRFELPARNFFRRRSAIIFSDGKLVAINTSGHP
jgi:hypothetical protein